MEKNENEKNGLLTVMQNQLDKIVSEMPTLNEEDVYYYNAIRQLIDFRLKESEVRKQFKEFNQVITAMSNLDFSKRIDVENAKDFFSYLGVSVNFLGEELEEKAIPKELMELGMNHVLKTKPDLAMITNGEGKIKFVFKNPDSRIGYNKEELLNIRIQNFITSYIHFNFSDKKFGEGIHLINSNSDIVLVNMVTEEIKLSSKQESYYMYMIKEISNRNKEKEA